MWEELYTDYASASLLGVVQLLRKWKLARDPYDLTKPLDDGDGAWSWSLVNTILFKCNMSDDDDEKKLVIEVLQHAQELKQYWDYEDTCYYGPLYWIEWHNEKLALKLLPYFKSRGYVIDIRHIHSNKILAAWDKLQKRK